MKQSIESEPIRDCKNNPINSIDPTGHKDVAMSSWVIANGGSVSWNPNTQIATAILNGHTETFNINEQLVIGGRIIGDDQNLARAFGVNLSSSNVETIRKIPSTVVTSCSATWNNDVPRTVQYLKSDEAQQAYKQTAGAVVVANAGIVCEAISVARAAKLAEAQKMKPPGWNNNWEWRYPEGTSTSSPRWFDPKGGEWRWHAPDNWHPKGHWDHNPWTQWNSPWQNIYP
ncbi:MAG: hypothetical protein HPY90_15060 [Syntrophothermus sp.]|uniref:hypothetical protein n=1 Tax=Syntrophothermus sp. TaxID=2736299 RepID=UPI00257FB2C4|nr:hypothetical protein [Syntrophothermus sp.]NSW84524.1 hypothetical protein [Syntrophothermus sp.]